MKYPRGSSIQKIQGPLGQNFVFMRHGTSHRLTNFFFCFYFHVDSGDSGSGKTDAHKLALRHLVALSSHKKPSKIQTQLLHSQAILEAFGNAKTSQNNNASRFGRYTEVQFSERGRIAGAKLLNYFLEKRRVTDAPSDERNFHAFYYLLAGASSEEKAELRLSDHSTFAYLSRCRSQTTADDATKFEDLKASLKALGFQKKHIARMMQLLAAILHLGNIVFVDDPSKGQEAANVKNVDVLSLAADFLGVDPHGLQLVLTYKTKLIKKDVTTVFLNAEQASKQRDDLATALYSLMFTWIVEQINVKLCNENFHSFIGIVDLPGPQNSQSQARFENYCVNYSNEKFHDFVLRQIFELDNAMYEQDGIKMPNVPYFSNSACVQLFDKPSNGLNAILSECTAKAQRRTDDNMLDSFVKFNNNHDSFSNRNAETGARQFSIQHFAGQVSYNPYGFIEGNSDPLCADFVNLFRGNAENSGSYNAFASNLFSQPAVSTQSHPKSSDDIVAAQQIAKPGRAPSMRRSKSLRKTGAAADKQEQENLVKVKNDSKGSANTSTGVMAQLQSALEELFATLEETTPWFIFCLNPNNSGSVNTFDSKRVKAQVRAYGLPEIAKRLATNYTMILDHEEFVNRYHDILLSMGVEEDRLPRSKCEAVGTMFGWSSAQMAVGSNNVSPHFSLYFLIYPMLTAFW